MKSCSPARRATWALDATSNPRPSINFLFKEDSEQQKKVFPSKKDFWKTVDLDLLWKEHNNQVIHRVLNLLTYLKQHKDSLSRKGSWKLRSRHKDDPEQ